MSSIPTTTSAQSDPLEHEEPLDTSANELAQPPRWRIVRTSWFVRWVLLPMVMCTLVLTAGFLVRTRMVLGSLVAPVLIQQARARGIDLYIGDLRPKGFTSVRLTRVRARTQRGAYWLDARLESIDITPDLLASLRAGKPVPESINLNHGDITLSRAQGPTRPKAASGTPKKSAASAPLGLESLKVVGRDLDVRFEAGQSFHSVEPLKMTRIEATIALGADALPDSIRAYGHLPDGTPFALQTKPGATPQARRFILKPQRPTRLDQWFNQGQVPFEMSVGEIAFCARCARDEVLFETVGLTLPTLGQGLGMQASRARVTWQSDEAVLQLPGVHISNAQRTTAKIEDSHFSFDMKTGTHTGHLLLKEPSGGDLRVQWSWDGARSALKGSLHAAAFSLAPFFELWGATTVFQQGTLDGVIEGNVNMDHLMVELQANIDLVDAIGQWPRLAKQPVRLDRVHVDAHTMMNVSARRLTVLNAQLELGQGVAFDLDGHIEDAGEGLVFGVNAQAKRLDAQRLFEAMPDALKGALGASQFKGDVSFDVHASGHTAFAESFQLRMDITPEVEVLIDDTGLKQLEATSRPDWPVDKFDPSVDLEQWVDASTLAPGVTRTLTAAEDAQFWRHKGFDPRGFERAMVHNLKVGRMARGGSTLSQQVVKNIFLTGERTIARKLQEVVLTWMMERTLPKTRILELYLNIAEWGPGARGLDQAGRLYFDRSAQALQPEHMALLGTILPSPRRFGAHIKAGRLPSSRLTKFEHVASNLRFLGEIEPSTYDQWMTNIRQGRVAGLQLTLCADDDTAPAQTPPCPPYTP